MKVLFLDVDGVLNSSDWFHKLDPKTSGAIHELDPKAVQRVLRVLEVTGAKIVLSSTWRIVPHLFDALTAQGLPIYDTTPRFDSGPRAAEIAAWLMSHPTWDRFAIIDDDSDAGELGLSPWFVRTRWKHGMYGKHEKALIALLEEPRG